MHRHVPDSKGDKESLGIPAVRISFLNTNVNIIAISIYA